MAWTDPQPSYTNGQIITQTDLHVGLRDQMRELWHEVAYVEFTANVTVSGVAEATPTDVVSSGAITYPAYPILIEFYSPLTRNTNAATITLSLWDAATDLGRIGVVGGAGSTPAAMGPVQKRLTPTAASHTYKIRAWGSGTVEAGAGGTGVNMPGCIRVWQRGG